MNKLEFKNAEIIRIIKNDTTKKTIAMMLKKKKEKKEKINKQSLTDSLNKSNDNKNNNQL